MVEVKDVVETAPRKKLKDRPSYIHCPLENYLGGNKWVKLVICRECPHHVMATLNGVVCSYETPPKAFSSA